MASHVESTEYDNDAFDRGTAPILRIMSINQARELVAYRGDDSLQQRIEELASKSNEGELTAAERAEYEGYVRANKFVAVLQAQARKYLSAAGGARMIDAATRRLVRDRAGNACEYCGLIPSTIAR